MKGNDVSFSGVLTAAKRLVDGGASFEDVCYSLQETAFAITTEVTERALAFTGARSSSSSAGSPRTRGSPRCSR